MLDLLAAIVSVDPPSLLGWLVLAFAAGMYPVGIMLGSSCSPCCGQAPCSQCTEGQLPDTLTVTFSGLQDQAPGPDLCVLTFTAPYGSGAAGKVTAPGGDPATNKGPITAVSLTSGGSGYAKLGRVAPTITASGGSGTGATFTVQTTSTNDANGIPSWGVTGVTWTGTTSGYVDNEELTFSVASGDTVAQGAVARIRTPAPVRTQPTVSVINPYGGTGATFSVILPAYGSPPESWSVSGVTVTNGGSGYPAGGDIYFSVAQGDTVSSPAFGKFQCGVTEPTVSVQAGGSGTGATLTASLFEDYDGFYEPAFWSVSSITPTNGGTGYEVGDPVTLTVTDGEAIPGYPFSAEVESVDQDGAILSVSVTWNERGRYRKNNGIIAFVVVPDPGSFYREQASGEIDSIEVDLGGSYYRESASQPPYVATVTVGVAQTFPSTGTGATFTATVESNTSSANFGKITGVTIGNGGTNYLAWRWRNAKCCGYYNGLSVVLKRQQNNPCFYEHYMCGVGNISHAPGRVALSYNGPASPPTMGLLSEWLPGENLNAVSSICNTTFTASGNVTNCSDWSGVSFTASGGATASVSAGGTYDPTFRNPGGASCFICCKGDSLYPDEIEIEVSSGSRAGAYVLYRNTLFSAGGIWVAFTYGTGTSWSAIVYHWVCSTQIVGQFIPDTVDGCDECHKKCKTVVNTTDGNADQNSCASCTDTPQCKPTPGTYTIPGKYSVVVL